MEYSKFKSYVKDNKIDLNTTWAGIWTLAYLEFHNYYELETTFAWNPEETINNARTRGGPATLNLPGVETNWLLNSDKRKKWVYGASFNLYEADTERYRAGGASLEWKPASNVSIDHRQI